MAREGNPLPLGIASIFTVSEHPSSREERHGAANDFASPRGADECTLGRGRPTRERGAHRFAFCKIIRRI
jgi:hypothetical protein